MSFDLIVANARLLNRTRTDADRDPSRAAALFDIGIADGRIAAIAPTLAHGAPRHDAGGNLVIPGLVETHIHLDKTCILDRCTVCDGTVQVAIREKPIAGGTQVMRAHTEIDPRIGLKGYRAIRQLARDYAWAIDVSLCVFPQEGLTNDPGADALLVEACETGAGAIGGAPYVDTDPNAQIARIFDLARRFDLDVDIHLDFDLDPTWTHLDEVCRQTDSHGWGGRVAAGHMTKLSAMPADRHAAVARRLADTGIAVAVLPSTDQFLMRRGVDHNTPRGVARADHLARDGVTVSLATNNVMNAFTPFGDASLLRMANLFANIAQLGRPTDLEDCLDMLTYGAAKLMNIADYGIEIGHPADLVVLSADGAASAVAELAQPLVGFKGGRRTFTRPAAMLHPPVAG